LGKYINFYTVQKYTETVAHFYDTKTMTYLLQYKVLLLLAELSIPNLHVLSCQVINLNEYRDCFWKAAACLLYYYTTFFTNASSQVVDSSEQFGNEFVVDYFVREA